MEIDDVPRDGTERDMSKTMTHKMKINELLMSALRFRKLRRNRRLSMEQKVGQISFASENFFN